MFPAISLCIYKITYDYNNFKCINIYMFLVIWTIYKYLHISFDLSMYLQNYI